MNKSITNARNVALSRAVDAADALFDHLTKIQGRLDTPADWRPCMAHARNLLGDLTQRFHEFNAYSNAHNALLE